MDFPDFHMKSDGNDAADADGGGEDEDDNCDLDDSFLDDLDDREEVDLLVDAAKSGLEGGRLLS